MKKKYKDPSQTIFVRNVNEFSARVYRPPSRLFISRNGVENTCFASMKIQLIGSVMLVFIEISFHATRQQISCIKYKKRTKYGFDCKKRPLWRWYLKLVMHHSFWKFSKDLHKICFTFYFANVVENIKYIRNVFEKRICCKVKGISKDIPHVFVMLNILKEKQIAFYCPWIV